MLEAPELNTGLQAGSLEIRAERNNPSLSLLPTLLLSVPPGVQLPFQAVIPHSAPVAFFIHHHPQVLLRAVLNPLSSQPVFMLRIVSTQLQDLAPLTIYSVIYLFSARILASGQQLPGGRRSQAGPCCLLPPAGGGWALRLLPLVLFPAFHRLLFTSAPWIFIYFYFFFPPPSLSFYTEFLPPCKQFWCDLEQASV